MIYFCVSIVSTFAVLTEFSSTDAVYTERYMGKPTENSDSYKVNIIQISCVVK